MKAPQWIKLNKSTWLLVLAVAFIVVIWLVVIFPAISRLRRTVQAIADAQTTQLSSTQATANLITALQRKNELIEHSATLNRLFVDRANPIVTVGRIEELASTAGVTLDLDIDQPTEDPTTTPVATATLGIRVAGEWRNILDFVNALYAEPLVLQTTEVAISTPSDSPDIVQLDLTTFTYWH
ncbi:MAG: hypothetical protein ACD_41C00194G0003 [uncultured bacterium]|nr:MAG: hypothetical protein ACD_41C00194G0003 [uncultured bacterium]